MTARRPARDRATGPDPGHRHVSESRIPLTMVDRGVMLEVRVQPGARRSEIVGRHGDALKVRIAAPAVDGRANDELVDFLARTFGIRRSRVLIRFGSTGRHKRVVLGGTDVDAVAETLDRLRPGR